MAFNVINDESESTTSPHVNNGKLSLFSLIVSTWWLWNCWTFLLASASSSTDWFYYVLLS